MLRKLYLRIGHQLEALGLLFLFYPHFLLTGPDLLHLFLVGLLELSDPAFSLALGAHRVDREDDVDENHESVSDQDGPVQNRIPLRV